MALRCAQLGDALSVRQRLSSWWHSASDAALPSRAPSGGRVVRAGGGGRPEARPGYEFRLYVLFDAGDTTAGKPIAADSPPEDVAAGESTRFADDEGADDSNTETKVNNNNNNNE